MGISKFVLHAKFGKDISGGLREKIKKQKFIVIFKKYATLDQRIRHFLLWQAHEIWFPGREVGKDDVY